MLNDVKEIKESLLVIHFSNPNSYLDLAKIIWIKIKKVPIHKKQAIKHVKLLQILTAVTDETSFDTAAVVFSIIQFGFCLKRESFKK